MTTPSINDVVADLFAHKHKNQPRTTPTPTTSAVDSVDNTPVSITDPVKYAAAALLSAHTELSSIGEGGRNDALNAVAFSLGKLVAAGIVNEDDATACLTDACHRNGLANDPGGNYLATIRSGLRGGARHPLTWTHTEATSTPKATPLNLAPAEAPEGHIPNPLPALNLALLNEPCPPPDWLVEGRMTRKSLTLLGSKPGVGKSWTALDLTLAITTGRDWLGHRTHKGRVLYIDVENGDTLATRRLQQLGADHDLIGDRLHYVTESVIFPGGPDSARLRDTLDAFKPDLVVIDTLASSAPSAEKDTESMSLFLNDVWHRSREAGAAVLVLAHLRKSQQGAGKDDPLDSFRGAGHLVGAASRAWLLEPKGADRFALRDVKTREFAACPTVLVRLADEETINSLLVAKHTRLVLEGEVDENEPLVGYPGYQHRCLAFIDNHPTNEAKTADLLTLSQDIEPSTASNYLTRMVRDGILTRPRGSYYARATRVPEEVVVPAVPFTLPVNFDEVSTRSNVRSSEVG